MIELDRLAIRVGGFALKDVSLRVETGQYAILMGKTGSGKTTLLEALCGLKPISAGTLSIVGRDVTHLRPAERGVGYVPQDLALFPSHSVREHLAFALGIRHWDRLAVDARVAELAQLLGLTRLLDRMPRGLSGGEQQRVALGRALSFRPQVLLLDEPLSALDEVMRGEMYGLLRDVQRQTGVTTLHVTHSQAEAHALADRLFVLQDGSIQDTSLQRA